MEVNRPTTAACCALLVAGALAACGQTGPLYLPGEARDIVTRPAPPESGEAADSPRTPDAPVEPPSPAPEVTAPATDEDKDAADGQKRDAPPPR